MALLRARAEGGAAPADRSMLFGMGATREPLFFVDVDLHSLALLGVQDLGPGTGWGRVPTPMF
jgi:hypothetical protein